jgi:hypothetical protein
MPRNKKIVITAVLTLAVALGVFVLVGPTTILAQIVPGTGVGAFGCNGRFGASSISCSPPPTNSPNNLGCQAVGYCSNSPHDFSRCSSQWVLSDDNTSYVLSAWRGSYRDWNDQGINVATINGVTTWYERSDLDLNDPMFPSRNNGDFWDKGHSSCTCGDAACSGTDSPAPVVFFDRASFGAGSVSLAVATYGGEKRNTDPSSPKRFLADAAWGATRVVCGPDERSLNGTCAPITGTLTAIPASCTSPCNVTLNWNTNAISYAKIYQNGLLWKTEAVSGGDLVSNLPAGTYQFRLTGDDGFNNESPTLDTKTVVVSNPIPNTPNLTSAWQDGSQSLNMTVTPGQTLNIPIYFWNNGQSGSQVSQTQCVNPPVDSNNPNVSGFGSCPNTSLIAP